MGPVIHCAMKDVKYYSRLILPGFVKITGMEEGIGMQLERWVVGLGNCFLTAWIFDPI
jgi:hypothetical protein